MIANQNDSNNPPEGDLQEELRALLDGLQEDVKALREEVTALRRKEATDGIDALLPREEAADTLGISVRTLDDLADAGEIRPVRIRGRVLYHPETLEAYVRRNAGGQTNEH
jgi:excisionase family DNA binding protein